MNVILFPFEIVRQGSRIIIYGFGNAGKQYWQQVIKTKYCDILYFVDINWKCLNNTFVSVRPVEALISEANDNYDNVLIAIDNPATSKRIANMLFERGISYDKIIFANERRIIWDNEILDKIKEKIAADEMTVVDWISYFDCIWLFTAVNYEEQPEKFFPDFYHYIENLKSETREAFLDIMCSAMQGVSNAKVRIRILWTLYKKGYFSAKCMKLFACTLLEMNWDDDTSYCFIMEMSRVVLQYEELIYPEFYEDRRELLCKICKYYNLKPGKLKGHRERIAVISYFYSWNESAYGRLINQLLNIYESWGMEVALFVANTRMMIDGDGLYFRDVKMQPGLFSFPKTRGDRICELTNRGVAIHWFEDGDIGERLQKLIDAIFDYSPKYVIDITDEYLPQSYILQQYFPVIYFPIRTYMSSAFFDTYITSNIKICLAQNKIYHSVLPEKMEEVKLGNMPLRRFDVLYERKSFAFSDEDFLMVTVGTRLKRDIKDDILCSVCEMMLDNPQVKWLLVGDKPENTIPDFLRLVEEKRIRLWGFEENIEALYRMCDIYLQPNRRGGGVSIRQAMREGLPVVATDYPADGTSLMDEGDLVQGNYSALMDYVLRLCNDKKFYAMCSHRMREIVEPFTPENDAKKILEVCEETWRRVHNQKKRETDE